MLNVLLFMLSIFGGILLTFILSPVFSFVLYEIMYFFNPQIRWWGSMVPDLSYSYFIVLMMAGSLVINYKKSSHNKIFAVPQMKWIYLILVLIFATSLIAIYPVYHGESQVYFLKLVIIMTVAYKLIDTEIELHYVQWGYIFGCWYLSFMAFQIGRNAGDRIEGIGTVDAPDTNMVAAAIAPSVILCLYYYWVSDTQLKKLAFAIAGAFIANALVLINSRGSFIGLICGLFYFMFYMFFSSLQEKFQKATVIWVVVIGLCGAAFIVDDSFIQRMKGIAGSGEVNEEAESASTRTLFWIAAWEMAKDYPFGAGVNGFEYYAPFYIPENVDTGASRNRAVHSTWFEALSEFGYLGLFFLLMMLRSCFKATGKCKKLFKERKDVYRYFHMIALEAGLISFILSMTFINRYRSEILYWLILFTMCAYNIYIVKPNKKDNN